MPVGMGLGFLQHVIVFHKGSDVLLKMPILNVRLYLIFELWLGLKHKCIVFECFFIVYLIYRFYIIFSPLCLRSIVELRASLCVRRPPSAVSSHSSETVEDVLFYIWRRRILVHCYYAREILL